MEIAISISFSQKGGARITTDGVLITPAPGQTIVQSIDGVGEIVITSPKASDIVSRDFGNIVSGAEDGSIQLNLQDRLLLKFIGNAWNQGVKTLGNNVNQFARNPVGYVSRTWHGVESAASNTYNSSVSWLKNTSATIGRDIGSVEYTLGTADGRLKLAQAAGNAASQIGQDVTNIGNDVKSITLDDVVNAVGNVTSSVVSAGAVLGAQLREGFDDGTLFYNAGHAVPGLIDAGSQLLIGDGIPKLLEGGAGSVAAEELADTAASSAARAVNSLGAAVEPEMEAFRLIPQFSDNVVTEDLGILGRSSSSPPNRYRTAIGKGGGSSEDPPRFDWGIAGWQVLTSGASGALGNVYAQYLQDPHGQINPGDAFIAGAFGAGSGAFGQFANTNLKGAALGALSNTLQYLTTTSADHQNFRLSLLASNAFSGGVVGLANGKYTPIIVADPQSRHLSKGVAHGMNMAATFIQNSRSLGYMRSFVGSTLTNLDYTTIDYGALIRFPPLY